MLKQYLLKCSKAGLHYKYLGNMVCLHWDCRETQTRRMKGTWSAKITGKHIPGA